MENIDAQVQGFIFGCNYFWPEVLWISNCKVQIATVKRNFSV